MLYEAPEYINNTYPPLRVADPKKKDYDYYLRNCQHIYSTFMRGGAFITYNSTQKFSELRNFAKGDQPIDFYKRYLAKYGDTIEPVIDPQMGVVGSKKKARGFMKPLWEVLSPAPKIITSMIGKLTQTQTDIYADPMDGISKSIEEDAKLDLWVTAQNMEVLKQAHALAGLEMQQPDFVPETQEELELYNDMGGFRPAFARSMEKLITHTMDISDYTQLENALYRDAISLGVCGMSEYYDPELGKYRYRIADPARAGIQYSEYNDCRTSEWCYEFRDETISNLMQYFPDRDVDYFRKLAFQFCGYAGNPAQTDFVRWNKIDSTGFMKFDFFKVPVLVCYWFDNEGEQHVIQKGNFRDKVYPVDYSDKVKQIDGKTSKFTTRRYVYGATWVIGTNDMYEWGKINDQAGESRLPYHFYVWEGKSKLDQIIPLLHNFQVLWLKYLNALALAVNSGYWINADMLANIATGGDAGSGENDKEISLRRFLDTGIGFYSRINAAGVQNLQDLPVSEFRGGMGQIFMDIMQAFQFNTTMIESITGINPIVLGATPNPNAPVTTTQMSVEAVSSIFKPLIDGYLSVKLGASKNICRLIHICVHTYPFSRKQYEKVIGEFDMQVLLSSDRDATEYAIRMEVRPGQLEKQKMIEMIQAASQTDRDGATGGLSGMEGIMLIRRLESGVPMLQVEMEFEYRRRKNMKAAQQAASANAQQQGQIVIQQSQAASELRIKEAAAIHAFTMEEIQEKNKGLLANTALQENTRMQKEQNIQQLKTDAEKYGHDIKANTQLNSDHIKANVQREVAAMNDSKKEEGK